MSGSRSPVVVGIDGTQSSVAALRWAAAEAERRASELLVVLPASRSRQPAGDSLAWSREQALSRLDSCLRAAFAGHPPVRVHALCDRREPVRALLAHSSMAALLVLAAANDPGQPQASGTVAHECLGRAHCPVVVVLTSRGAAASAPAGSVLLTDVAAS